MWDDHHLELSVTLPIDLAELNDLVTRVGKPGTRMRVEATVTVPAPEPDPVAEVTVPDPSKAFFRALRIAEDGREAPVNELLVGSDGTTFGVAGRTGLTREQALAAAAWIVAVADPLGKEFPAILAAVMRS